jgi:plasmid segregation protein ParM
MTKPSHLSGNFAWRDRIGMSMLITHETLFWSLIMELIVRAVDVGSGNTKFVTAATGTDIRCASFQSVAYPSSDAVPALPASERRQTVCIPVGPLFYEVGPDVGLAADTFRARQLHDAYTESPEYLALLRGALSMMKLRHIDLLVVGLPVSHFAAKKAALEKLMVGSHDVGGGRTVTVGKALAVAQPQGALVHYACEHKRMTTIGNEQSLIIDPGSRTFDWIVARGMRMVQKQSHSLNRGMSDVFRLLARDITKSIGTPYSDYDVIDRALRTGKSPVIYQKAYDMSRHLPLAESVAAQAVSTMREWIESPHSLQNIILVGGGAFLFRKAVKAAFPLHKIHEVKEPMFANVRGFQLAGQNYARTVMQASRSDQGGAEAGGAE